VHPQVRVVPLEPLHRLTVRGQAVLDEQVLAHPHHISRVPHRLHLGGHEVLVRGTNQALLQRDLLVVVVVLVRLVRQTRPRSLRPLELRVLLEVLVHQRPVRQVLPVPAPERVRRRHDLIPDGQQDVPRRHLGETRTSPEVRGHDLLVPLQRGGTIHLDAQTLQDLHVVVQLLIRGLHRRGGPGAPHAAHLGIDRHLLRRGGLLRRDHREVRTTHDHVLQRIEVIPRVDDLRHGHSFVCVPCIGRSTAAQWSPMVSQARRIRRVSTGSGSGGRMSSGPP